MDRKTTIHEHLNQCALELLEFIKETESNYEYRWVPTAYVKSALNLNLVAVPKGGTQRGEKGWLFAIQARMLEDKGLLEYDKRGSRSYCRSTIL
jgi:hypothetical protein